MSFSYVRCIRGQKGRRNQSHSLRVRRTVKDVPAHWAATILSDLTTSKTTLDTMADLDYRPTVEEYGSEYSE